jgi:hypothetical protein
MQNTAHQPTPSPRSSRFERISKIVSFVRDIALLLGVPALIVVGIRLYDLQIKALEAQVKAVEAQNNLLRETQYDRALSIIKAQKDVYPIERDTLISDFMSSLTPQHSESCEDPTWLLSDPTWSLSGVQPCSTLGLKASDWRGSYPGWVEPKRPQDTSWVK